MQVLVRSVCLTLVALLLSAADDPIRAKLAAMQPAQTSGWKARDKYVVFDRWRDHRPRTIFAVLFTDTEPGTALFAFHVARNGTLHRLATYEGGLGPRDVDLVDLTGDGVPEAVVLEAPAHGIPEAILRWDGKTFHLIGKTNNPDFRDLDHDGILEVIELVREGRNACGVEVVKPHISKYEHGKIREITPKRLANLWLLTAGHNTEVVVLPDNASTRCRFHIVNGTRGGQQRATAIELRAWGEVLDPPAMHHGQGVRLPLTLTRHDEYVDMTVNLPSRCTEVDVTLQGPADATAIVMIETTHIKSP